MFSIIKRILRLSGKYRPRVIAGLIFNALKSCCAAFVFFAVLLVMLNIEHLTETVILQAFGIVALSVLGRFLFQYLSDVLMSASGYEIFREKRLEIGNQLKRAPMGYFTENNLGTVQTVLTTTISDLEGNCMLALTFLVGGFVQALAMTLMLGIFCWQIGFLALTGILAGILVLGQIKKRAGAHTEDMQNAQELLVGSALEYIKGISVLRIFGKGKEGKGKVDQAFENKCRSDIAVTISTAGIMKLYEAVFKITSCLLFLLSALLYLWGVITLPYCLLFIICAFLMFMELELMNDGAFLSKMLATQLDRLDFISDIPVLDGDGKDIVLKSYEIELKDVIFAYDSRPVLDGITLKIPQNSTCAIVGPSGSGKTTLCNMIARFWDVNSGSVKIGGHDVKEFTCDSLLSYVSMVFQKVYLFNDTIENNIKFGKPNATHADSIPLRGIRDRRKKNSSLAPVTGIPLGMELHAGKMAGVQNDFAAFPLVPGKLLGLLPAVCRHLHFHLQRFPDGNIIMVHHSRSSLKMGSKKERPFSERSPKKRFVFTAPSPVSDDGWGLPAAYAPGSPNASQWPANVLPAGPGFRGA